eukprot:4460038-Alexandrium_andersonii.AAC.1
MSASLVGSEMCIRDRGLGRPSLHDYRNYVAAFFNWYEFEHDAIPWPLNICLLYTSDAADDM